MIYKIFHLTFLNTVNLLSAHQITYIHVDMTQQPQVITEIIGARLHNQTDQNAEYFCVIKMDGQKAKRTLTSLGNGAGKTIKVSWKITEARFELPETKITPKIKLKVFKIIKNKSSSSWSIMSNNFKETGIFIGKTVINLNSFMKDWSIEDEKSNSNSPVKTNHFDLINKKNIETGQIQFKIKFENLGQNLNLSQQLSDNDSDHSNISCASGFSAINLNSTESLDQLDRRSICSDDGSVAFSDVTSVGGCYNARHTVGYRPAAGSRNFLYVPGQQQYPAHPK